MPSFFLVALTDVEYDRRPVENSSDRPWTAGRRASARLRTEERSVTFLSSGERIALLDAAHTLDVAERSLGDA
jgi:hypothetical protein